MPYRCSECGIAIVTKYGRCPDCNEIKKQRDIEKKMNRLISKTHNTIEWGMGQVKKYADGRCWCSAHEGCFRCSFGKNETPLHRDTKYERWKHHKELGRYVFCELRLKELYGIPDLVVVDNGFIFIEEIVVSEKEASLIAKKKKYPWPVNIIRAKKKSEEQEKIDDLWTKRINRLRNELLEDYSDGKIPKPPKDNHEAYDAGYIAALEMLENHKEWDYD